MCMILGGKLFAIVLPERINIKLRKKQIEDKIEDLRIQKIASYLRASIMGF